MPKIGFCIPKDCRAMDLNHRSLNAPYRSRTLLCIIFDEDSFMEKRLIKTIFAIVAAIFTFLPPTFAQETGFLESEKATFLYRDTKTLDMDYDGEKIRFTSMRDGTLRLTSANLKHDYLSFIPYDGSISKLCTQHLRRTGQHHGYS